MGTAPTLQLASCLIPRVAATPSTRSTSLFALRVFSWLAGHFPPLLGLPLLANRRRVLSSSAILLPLRLGLPVLASLPLLRLLLSTRLRVCLHSTLRLLQRPYLPFPCLSFSTLVPLLRLLVLRQQGFWLGGLSAVLAERPPLQPRPLALLHNSRLLPRVQLGLLWCLLAFSPPPLHTTLHNSKWHNNRRPWLLALPPPSRPSPSPLSLLPCRWLAFLLFRLRGLLFRVGSSIHLTIAAMHRFALHSAFGINSATTSCGAFFQPNSVSLRPLITAP